MFFLFTIKNIKLAEKRLLLNHFWVEFLCKVRKTCVCVVEFLNFNILLHTKSVPKIKFKFLYLLFEKQALRGLLKVIIGKQNVSKCPFISNCIIIIIKT